MKQVVYVGVREQNDFMQPFLTTEINFGGPEGPISDTFLSNKITGFTNFASGRNWIHGFLDGLGLGSAPGHTCGGFRAPRGVQNRETKRLMRMVPTVQGRKEFVKIVPTAPGETKRFMRMLPTRKGFTKIVFREEEG